MKVENDGQVPADMVLLHANDDQDSGTCYVLTKNLDGETNLKLKQAPKSLNQEFKNVSKLKELKGSMKYEEPNDQIYKFKGNFSVKLSTEDEIKEIGLKSENILLRGTSLKNTPFVYGCVVYTGHDTKIQMNNSSASYKTSKLMRHADKQILTIFLVQVLISFACAVIGARFLITNRKN